MNPLLRTLPLLAILPAMPAAATEMDIDSVLAETVRNARERAEPAAELEKAWAQSTVVDGAYDWLAFGDLRTVWDRSEMSSILAGERRDQQVGTIGLRKLFASGTAVEASITHKRDYTEYPALPPGTPFDPARFIAANPAYTTELGMTVRQPLWRNWLGRELELQRELAGAGTRPAELQQALAVQLVQAEAERLYLELAMYERQSELLARLLALSRRFAEQMARRRTLGRADDVDVAAAEAAVVAQEGALLRAEIAAENVRKRLRLRMAPDSKPLPPGSLHAATGTLDAPLWPLPASDPETAISVALRQRIDLQLIEAARAPLDQRLALLREQRKPQLALYAGVANNGLDGAGVPAVADTFSDNHLRFLVGLQADIPVQHTANAAEQRSLAAEKAIQDARAAQIAANLRRDIELAFSGMASAAALVEQAERTRFVLQAKRDAEQSKLALARTDEVAVLRYDLELLAADGDRIAALKSARDAEAALRLILHAYPR